MHSKSSGASNTHHKYVNSSWRDCGRLQGVRGDIVPVLVIRCCRERAAFSKGDIAWVVYLFLHHDGAFIIFTPRVHTSGRWFSSPFRFRHSHANVGIPWHPTIEISRKNLKDHVFLLVIARENCLLSCRVWFSMTLEDPCKTRYSGSGLDFVDGFSTVDMFLKHCNRERNVRSSLE